MLKLLLFADDIAILASSPDQLQKALDLMAMWAKKRGLRWGHAKCKVMRLSRPPSDKTTRMDLARYHKMKLDGHVLAWVEEFKYLGITIVEAPEHRRRRPLLLPTDKNKIRSLCIVLLRMFPSTARCTRAAPLAARLGVLQVIHAKFLYPTALLDIDYNILDVQINKCLRRLCGLPLCTPSALLHADLGVWPSRFYAHQRALTFLYRLRWKYWTKDGFKQWYDATPTDETPKCLLPSWVSRGVLARFGRILEMYGMSWNDLREEDKEWKQRVSKAIQAAFARECKEAAGAHCHPWLEYPQPTRRPRIRHCLRLGGDLALAALRMRCPRLRLVPSYDHIDHGICRYCRDGTENGAHLVLCPSLPEPLLSRRDSIVKAIASEARIPLGAIRNRNRTSAILDYIMNFAWPNMTDDLLKRLLVLCRDLINKYAAFKPAWEAPEMASYPVHRVRPVYRPPSSDA